MKKFQRGFSEIAALFVVIFLIFVATFAISWTADYFTCKAQWSRAGVKFDWGPIQGCMVQTKDNKWVPADRVREVDL